MRQTSKRPSANGKAAKPTAAQSKNNKPIPMADSVAQVRTRRRDELLQKSLESDNPLEANLGAVQVDLLDMATQLKEFLAVAFPDSAENWAEFEQLTVGCNTMLRVTSQVERYAHLSLKFQEAKERAIERRAKTPVAKSAASEESKN
jgi:hypothetical protein